MNPAHLRNLLNVFELIQNGSQRCIHRLIRARDSPSSFVLSRFAVAAESIFSESPASRAHSLRFPLKKLSQ